MLAPYLTALRYRHCRVLAAFLAVVLCFASQTTLPSTAEAASPSFFNTLAAIFGAEKAITAWQSVFNLTPRSGLLAQVVSTGNTYYVAPSGNDANSGSLTSPWKTITKGVSALNAGDTLYVRGGTYVENGIRITRSGTASAPITVAAYPGESPVIDGQNVYPTGQWGALVSLEGDYITVTGFEVKNSNSDPVSNSYGVKLIGNHNTLSHSNVHETQSNTILIQGDYGTVEYCKSWRSSLVNENQKGNGWGAGLSAARGGPRSIKSGITSYPIIRHNEVYQAWGEGLSVFESDHAIIEDNIVHDNFALNIYLSDATNALVQRNIVYVTPNNGMGTGGGQRSTITLADEVSNGTTIPYSANNTIINNLCLNAGVSLFGWTIPQGSGFKNSIFAGNTIVNGHISTDSSYAQNVNSVIANNIITGDNTPVTLYAGSATNGITWHHNLWPVAPIAAASGVGDIINANAGLAKVGGISTGLTSAYFDLLSTSPAINKGTTLTARTADYYGHAFVSTPDMGAIEYTGIVSTAPTATLTASPTSITSGQSSTLTWSSTNSTSCLGTGFATGGANSGSTAVAPTTNTTYTLACTGAGGTTNSSATVTVTAAQTFPDLTVTALSYDQSTGLFTSTIKNQGSAEVSTGTWIGVAYSVDGVKQTWGGMNGPLAAGASVTVGTNGGAYTIPTGTHTISALADDQGAVSEPNENNNTYSTIVIIGSATDTTAPVVSLTAPTASATLSGNTTVTASASDNVGVVGVQFKLDGVNLGSEDTTAPYSVTWDTTTATNGSHTLTATARDAAGNTTTSSGVVVTVSNTVSTKFSLSDRVSVTSGPLNVRSTANGTLLGTQATDALGTVLGGPTVAGGYTWWNINFDAAPDGWVAEDFIRKNVAPTALPTITLSATPSSISTGQVATLTWSATNSTTCFSETFATSGTNAGSVQVSPAMTTTYTIACTGPGGTSTKSITVTVTNTSTTIFSDSFETALLWVKTGYVTWYTGSPKNGAYDVRLRKTGSVEKVIPTTGYSGVRVSFNMGANSLDTSAEYVQAAYFNGTSWVELARIENNSPNENNKLNAYSFTLPNTVQNLATFALRFKVQGDGTRDYGFIDDVVVMGVR